VLDLAAQNACLEVGDRLYRRLVEFSMRRAQPLPGGAVRIDHGLFQSELAACVGASRESVNRQLAAWRSQGLLEPGRRYVIVKDPLGLAMAVSRAARGSDSPIGS
jgi:CRP-like cAMP-binding protein